MSQPLGHSVGNAVEVYECVQILRGEKNDKAAATLELSLALSAAMLVLSGVADTPENARAKLQQALDSGTALEKFRENVLAQGGDPGICDNPEKLLAKDLKEVPIKITADGFLESIDTIAVGEAICAIGGGRMKAEDKVDHAVGYLQEIKIGETVRAGDTLGILYCRSQNAPDFSCQKIANACKISPSKIETTPLVLEEIGG